MNRGALWDKSIKLGLLFYFAAAMSTEYPPFKLGAPRFDQVS
jgi:hypothetical protein